MRLAYLNLLTALISLLAAVIWTFGGSVMVGLIWAGASLAWMAAAVYAARHGGTEPRPAPRLLRRLSRMLMYFG